MQGGRVHTCMPQRALHACGEFSVHACAPRAHVAPAPRPTTQVEREEWKFDTLCDLYDTLTITQVGRGDVQAAGPS